MPMIYRVCPFQLNSPILELLFMGLIGILIGVLAVHTAALI